MQLAPHSIVQLKDRSKHKSITLRAYVSQCMTDNVMWTMVILTALAFWTTSTQNGAMQKIDKLLEPALDETMKLLISKGCL